MGVVSAAPMAVFRTTQSLASPTSRVAATDAGAAPRRTESATPGEEENHEDPRHSPGPHGLSP